MNNKRHTKSISRKAWYKRQSTWAVSACIALFAALVGGYGTMSAAHWRQLPQDAQAVHAEKQQDIIGIIQSQDMSTQQRAQQLQQINGLQDGDCVSVGQYSWQASIFNAAKKQRSICERVVRENQQLLRQAAVLGEYLDSEVAMTEILQKLTPKKELKEKEWKTQYDKVKSATKELKMMSVNEEYKPVHTAVAARVAGLSKAWKQFMVAHKNEDRAAFEEATDNLQKAYKEFQGITEVSQSELEKHLQLLRDRL